MSYTTYGLLKAMRSHTIDSPSVATSIATGRPNACNQCHLDKTLAWTSQHLQDWYGIAPPSLSHDEASIAGSILWLLRGDAGQRALMAWSYGWSDARSASGTDWMAPYLAQLLEDPYAAVRLVAERSLRTLAGYERLDYNFLETAKELAAANQRVRSFWSSSSNRERVTNPAVLIDESQGLNVAEFQRLLDQRDNRDVTLAE
jgi:hypothetical protein